MGKINDTQFMQSQDTEANSPQMAGMNARAVLTQVYGALEEKGYNPVIQLVGYIMSGDPTYITNHKGARALIRKVDRDELVAELLENYIGSVLR